MDISFFTGLIITAIISGLIIYRDVTQEKKMGCYFVTISIFLTFTFAIIVSLLVEALIPLLLDIIVKQDFRTDKLLNLLLIIASGLFPALGLSFFFLLAIGSDRKDNIWQFIISFIIQGVIPLSLLTMLGAMLYHLSLAFTGQEEIELSLLIIMVFFSLLILMLIFIVIKNYQKSRQKKLKKQRSNQ